MCASRKDDIELKKEQQQEGDRTTGEATFDDLQREWNSLAEEIFPGVQSAKWNIGGKIKGGGLFASPKDMARNEKVLEHGRYLVPMIKRYGEVCRGQWGERRTLNQRDFEKLALTLRSWVEHGTAPFWAKNGQKNAQKGRVSIDRPQRASAPAPLDEKIDRMFEEASS